MGSEARLGLGLMMMSRPPHQARPVPDSAAASGKQEIAHKMCIFCTYPSGNGKPITGENRRPAQAGIQRT